ncbi:MAG: hypothetical protein ACE5OZ_26320 [Candidatus Heimdallarchaeota archaeon]
MSDFSETLDLAHLRTEIDKVIQLIDVKGIRGFYISTPFSKGYQRTEASSPNNFNSAIVETILILLKEHKHDGSYDKVNIEDQTYTPLFEISLFSSMVELKDLRKVESRQKYKIILQTPQ